MFLENFVRLICTMAETELKNILLKKDLIFKMRLEEFRNMFPNEYRAHGNVDKLYDTILEQSTDKRRKVKENLNEMVMRSSSKPTEKKIDCDVIMKMTKRPVRNLRKDLQMLDKSIIEVEAISTSYSTYFEGRSEVMAEEHKELPEPINQEEIEFNSHLEMLSIPG